jgi:hypothetical protein
LESLAIETFAFLAKNLTTDDTNFTDKNKKQIRVIRDIRGCFLIPACPEKEIER